MLDLAGILLGNVGGDAKVGQIAGQQDMALIDFVGNLPALVGQMDEAVGLEKPSSVAISIERTEPFRIVSRRMVSK